MSQDISTALELIVGKTIRDRTEGMRMLQDALKRDSVVSNIDERGDGKAWLYIFQKIFPLVLDEREKYMKSSGDKITKRAGPDAAARLEKAANFVRWLTERSVSNLNRRVIKPLVAHLAQMIIHNGTVFLPVALSYVKALRAIAEFRPHMDHLDSDTWSHLMAISFAAVLGTRLSHSLSLEDLSGTADSNVDGESGDEAETIISPRRKRQRIMSPPVSASSAVHLKSARLDQIEFVALIRALLAHPNASFMMTSISGAPSAILSSFSQYFFRYPSEGTAHQDAIWALNSALISLELNRSQEVIKFGAQLWFPLLDLWATKTRAIKEGLVLTFNLLMPLMVESDNTQFPKADAIARLSAALDGEPSSRSGLEGLSLDTLRLQLSQTGKAHGAFETRSFRHGADFSPSHALSWVALQLQADCIAKMLTLTGPASDTPRRGGKSLRLSNPVLSLLSQVKAVPSTRNYRLQVLLFLIDRHWDKLSPLVQSEICSTLSVFFSQDDHTSSSWAFICCATIACAQGSASNALSPNQISEEIIGFWTHAIRKTTVPLECRAACHAANAIARNGHLDDQTLFKDIEAFAADLLVQGPAFPHDSVCAFLIECLRVASRDAGLYRKQLEDKVLGWLSESWNVTETVRNNARARVDTYSLGDILELLQTACIMTRRILPVAIPLLPDCATTEIMLERHQSDLIRDFLIYAHLPAFRPNDSHTPGIRDSVAPNLLQNTSEIADKDLSVPNDRARKSSAFLLKSLDALLAEWDSAKDVTLMSREAARRAADLACLALWFEASLVSDGMRANARVIKAACSLVQQIVPCISASRWTTDERAMMLLAFDVLINDGEDTVEHTPWKGILDPDVGTGIKRRALAQMIRRSGPTTEDFRIRRGLLQKIWRSQDTRGIFAELSQFLRQSMHSLKPPNLGEEKSTGFDADGFSEIRTKPVIIQLPSVATWTYASQIAFSTCLAQKDLAHIPSHLLGYKSMEERIEESFRLVGPTLLLVGGLREPVSHGIKQFQSLCKTIGISESQGLRNCFHDVIGLSIVFYHEESLDEDTHKLAQEATTDLKDVLLKRANEACPPEETPQDYFIRVAPQIVVSIARTINGAPGEDIVSSFHLQAKGNAAKDFEAFQYYWGDEDFPVHDPVLPAFRPQTVIASLFWFLENHSALFVESHLAYHVAHHLFTAINRSPLVNEQLRLLRALSVVVACLKPFRKDWTLLRTLIHGYSLLLTQPDLARMAQSALDWCFLFVPKHVSAITSSSPRLEVLGRMGRIAYDYTRENDAFMRHLGDKLMDWVEGVTAKLEKQASSSTGDGQTLYPEILNVLALWPRELKYSELVLRAEELDSDNMSYILQHYASNTSKFRTVHRLLSITQQDTHHEDARRSTFAKADFWHLKSCIPSADEVQSEDAAAFTELLFLNKGNIRALTSDRHDAHSVDAIHRSYAAKNKRDSTSPLSAILIILFDLVYSEDASKVFTAYQTIGRLSNLEVDLGNFPGTPSISRGVQHERAFYPRHTETPLTILPRSLDELLIAEDLKSSATDYSSWVRTLSSYFCAVLSTIKSQDFFAQLVDIVRTDEIMAKQLLPVLVHAVLQHEDYQLGIPKNQYDAETARSRISTYFTELITQNSICTAIIDCLIQVMLHLRNFYPLSGVEPRDMLAYNHWLDVDYRLLAEGALRCGAYTTGILFLELYEDRAHDFPDDSVTRSTEEILYDIYSHIDEPDGFYGIRSDDIQSHLIRRFHHEGRWDKAFQFLGAMFESPGASASSTPGVLHSLQSFGFENMAMTMINGSKNAQVPSTDDGYTLGWRTETWDLPVTADNLPPGSALYYALRAVHQERDPGVVLSRICDARGNEMERLRALGSEDMSHIKKSIRALMCIGEVRRFLDHPKNPKALCQTFTPLSPDFEFDDYESLVATRLSLLRANIHKNRAMQIGNIDSEDTKKLLEYEQDLLIKLSQAARDSQKNQIALNSIIRAGNDAQNNGFGFVQEYASVMWANQEQKMAVGFLRQFLGRPEDKHKRSPKDAVPYAQLLSLLGTWVSDARLEQPMDIREKYFGRAEKMLEGLHQHPSHAIVYHRYAKFAEEQYDTALKFSPEVRRLKARMDRKKNELDQISESLRRSVGNAQLTQQQRKSQALLKADTEQFDRHTKSQRVFLEQAIEMYARCLVADDSENNETIIRFFSLWFANFSDSALNMSVLRGALQQIPSHKFVFLAHQISARLSTTSDPSHSNIRNLMARLCHDHPFHTLYQVYALASAGLGGTGATVNRRQSRAAGADPQLQTKRNEAARIILERLQREDIVGKRVVQFVQLCNACLQWAKYSLKQDKALKDSKNKVVPQHMELAKLKDLDVPVSTAFTPIDMTCRYEDNIVRLSRYGSRFLTAGGINLPKINDCIGEDGERYKQLFKGEGEDDLRQDAVMEQVFELVNILLKRDRSSKRRNLRVRTYKVIPLASQAGLLEFVTNTMPMSGWLLNAHKKYNPKDWQSPVCTEHLRKARGTGKPQALLDIFMEIRRHFRPVMRHFFTDAHKLPTAWFDMRLNYQRSVATTSIVGHVLGLGDRHLSNILIHNMTGEVVHIDLGIAFDQGRLLPIPETVPFRLTADIVDGLGSTGTEGVFRRCAEETLRVLRDQASVIKTILEVFNHDPLHSWSAAPVKIKHIQGTADTDMDGAGLDSAEAEAADRALSSVARKLDTSMSVEYTVNDLIATATDPANLCQLFVGWNPHV
ncbi:unnamed protein product [Rhizoctonia solani]|uniref:Serine/threonine-protein kinase Tel1 n=1 Tax=Rhizoctonia solani TaxID=456999 RepID=A0A8H3HF65_9AGAM|nr:unnamed protein product [Rhizoctonia solani]